MQENQQRWDLTSLFSHFEGEDYKKALKEFEEGCCLLQKFVDNKPSEGNFSSWLKMYLDVDNKVGALFESLNAYVYSVYSTQTTDSKALNEIARLDEKSLAYNKTALAFRGIISQFSNLLDSFYESYPHFKDYDYVLREEIQLCAHQMSVAEENLAQDMQRYGGDAWSRLHEQIISNLQDAETGKSFNELRNEAYAEEREIRKKAYEKELSLLKASEIPIAAALNNIKGATNCLNKRRHWDSALDKACASHRVERKTLDALIAAMEESLPMWRRYLKIKAKNLGLETCSFYDLFAPLKNTQKEIAEKQWTYPEAIETIIEKFTAFSPEMGNFVEKASKNHWIDVPITQGKIGGAFCIDFPYHKQSRVLVNFTGVFSDVVTLAHELGHAYHHSCIGNKDYALQHYPMTLAETASIFAENLVMQDAIARADGYEKAKLVEMHLSDSCQVVVDILCRFYFERKVFELRQEQELTSEDFCAIMAEAQEKTYGAGLSLERHEYMWAVKTHYYSPDLDFYNFPYAFGLLFALGLYNRFKTEGNAAAEKYKEILSNTGSYSCEKVCDEAGFDITKKDFWLKGMSELAEELEILEKFVG